MTLAVPEVISRSLLRARLPRALVLFVIVALLAGTANADRLYRYRNAEGFWVISSSVPNDRVAHGYKVIDEVGRVIEEVAPQRTPEEARKYRAAKQAERDRTEAIRRINLLYSGEDDIDYALNKALKSIDTSIANTQANIVQLRSQRQRLEGQAARIERAGNSISEAMVDSIATLDSQIKTLETEIANRTAEKGRERSRHARDRALFREVHGFATAE